MVSPRVSVILPVYNVEGYLGECLDSILAQTLKAIEVICVDDGSTDGSPRILEDYAARDARVRVIRQANAGAGPARNTGLAAATGDYVAFADPDDWCRKDMLELLLTEAERHDCDMVLSGARRIVFGTGQAYYTLFSLGILRLARPFAPEELGHLLFVVGGARPWAKLYKRHFVVDNKIEFQSLPQVNDLYFSFVALASAKRISVVNAACYNYRIGRPGSLQETVRASRRPMCWLEAFGAVRARLVADGVSGRFSAALGMALLKMGGRAMVKLGVAKDLELFYSGLHREAAELLDAEERQLKSLPERERGFLELLAHECSPLPFLAAFNRELQSEILNLRAWKWRVRRERARPLIVRILRAIKERLLKRSGNRVDV